MSISDVDSDIADTYERYDARRAGWAIFTGCDGDDPSLAAVFIGPGSRALAEHFANAKDPTDADEFAFFDPQVVPVMVADDGVHCFNHYDNDKCITALAALAGPFLEEEHWQ